MKFSRKKLTFIPVLVLISAIIFPSFTALAADASYKFSAIDLKLKVPEELICFTQTTTGNNAYLKDIGALLEVYGTFCHIDTENREEINSGYNNADNGPAEYYSFHGLDIRVGLIQAIHGKFCDTCNRIRVTADGRLMPCLGSSVTMDLVPDSCEFTDDLEKDFVIVQALKAAIKAKPGCHNFNDNAVTYTKTTETKTTETKTTELKAAEVNAARNMSRIGG